MKIKNISPLGALDLPLIGRVLEPGEVFELTGPAAEELLKQTDNYKRVDKPKPRQSAEPTPEPTPTEEPS